MLSTLLYNLLSFPRLYSRCFCSVHLMHGNCEAPRGRLCAPFVMWMVSGRVGLRPPPHTPEPLHCTLPVTLWSASFGLDILGYGPLRRVPPFHSWGPSSITVFLFGPLKNTAIKYWFHWINTCINHHPCGGYCTRGWSHKDLFVFITVCKTCEVADKIHNMRKG